MNRAERARLDRLNTWTCSSCGTTAVSDGCEPHGWWTVAQRGPNGTPTRYACSVDCLQRLAMLVAA